MIFRIEFEGDDNEELKDAQNRLYGWAVRWIVDHAWEHYRYAEEVQGLPEDKKLPGLEWMAKFNVSSFDHRTVQETHDILAAGYRQVHKMGEKHWEEKGDGKALEDGWDSCVRSETRRWMSDPFIVRAIVTATQYANKSEGLAAERALARYLREMYGLPTRDDLSEKGYVYGEDQGEDQDEHGEDELEEKVYTLEDLGEFEETQDEPEWESEQVDDEDEEEDDGEEGEEGADGEDDEDGDESDEGESPGPSQSARGHALVMALAEPDSAALMAAIGAGPQTLADLVEKEYLSAAQRWDEKSLHPDSQEASEQSILDERAARRGMGRYTKLTPAQRLTVLEAASLLRIEDPKDWEEGVMLA